MSLPAALAPGTVIGGHYIIGTLINQGGFGAVYRGTDTSENNRPCAIKETYDVTPAARRQALMEASVLLTVRSPHLPEVYDTLEANGRFYLIMQLIEGQNLLQLLRSRVPNGQVGVRVPGQLSKSPCSEQEVLSWLLPLMDALQELHSRRPAVMHRDIKPGNIVLTPTGTAVLLDFGLTKLYDPNSSTQTLGRAVTEGFSPLEQYVGKTSPQSDIYSMAATMYILLTNRLPPAATSRGVRDELVAPRLLDPSLSPKLEWVLLKALALHADQRFTSIGEMARILREPTFNDYDEPTVSVPYNPPSPIVAGNSGAASTPYNDPTIAVPYNPAATFQGSGNAPSTVQAPLHIKPNPSPISASYPFLPGTVGQAGAYSPISPQQSSGYTPGGAGQQQMGYPGMSGPQGYGGYSAPQTPVPGYGISQPVLPLTPAQQKKRARAQAAANRPLPVPADQGCLWGVLQGLVAAALVLFFKEQVDFYLAMIIGFLFYVGAGFMTSRRGGSPVRGAWAGYWTGIFGTITFWIVLGIGLLVSALQRFQILTRYNTGVNPGSLFSQAWNTIQPQWPAIPALLANQPPFVNYLVFMLIGLLIAWTAGGIGGFWSRAQRVTRR
ncbi:serine/threonine protein kinase [Dictyobacter arantiisoli]|uniref:Protein kinase domain-containing protein n=1 Tax=Dictyobacter arantiisoli TaxID=2014874 RepID=A0A5A5T9M3_9CHLR|nr:serine/threonine-protein kinase [Dictyobacter arantiisoli]GCF07689.1 hypothetical protein KDI_12530 [Dictyobacter arantiisoli]